MHVHTLALLATLSGATMLAGSAAAQTAFADLATASHVVVPSGRSLGLRQDRAPVTVTRVHADVRILDRTARTLLTLEVSNPGAVQAEAVVLVPVPKDAAVGTFMFSGQAAEPTARLYGVDEARRIYNEITSRLRDPALLEFVGWGTLCTRVFPVPAGGTVEVAIGYEEVLDGDGARTEYTLPRSESLADSTRFTYVIEAADAAGLSAVYSPTHDLVVEARSPRAWRVRGEAALGRDAGSLRLVCLRTSADISATLFAYPDPAIDGGYFLMVAALGEIEGEARAPRDLRLVLDTSGSMAGEKASALAQAVHAILQHTGAEDHVNVFTFSSTVDALAPAPLAVTATTRERAEAFLHARRPTGGTNLYDAIVAATSQPVVPGATASLVVVTDGIPTIGRTDEVSFAALSRALAGRDLRVHVCGLGADLNAPLLDRLAETTRARATYILEPARLGDELDRLARRMATSEYRDVVLAAKPDASAPERERTSAVFPAQIGDVAPGEPLVVLGRYHGDAPLELEIRATVAGSPRAYAVTFPLARANVRNAFVARLWATRAIGTLIDEVRQLAPGSEAGRRQALVDEILGISVAFGVVTEYTAFLATEGTDLGQWRDLRAGCSALLANRAQAEREGLGAIAQAANVGDLKRKSKLDYSNAWLDNKLERVQVSRVQQVSDRALYLQGTRWVDGTLVQRQTLEADRVVTVGSPEHCALAADLAAQGRAGLVAVPGEILLENKGERVLVVPGEPSLAR